MIHLLRIRNLVPFVDPVDARTPNTKDDFTANKNNTFWDRPGLHSLQRISETPLMNLLLKMGIVPIFFLPLIAGWAGTQEESKVVEQPPVKPTEPWQITVGPRLAGRGQRHHRISRHQLQHRAYSPQYQRYLFVWRRSQKRALWCSG